MIEIQKYDKELLKLKIKGIGKELGFTEVRITSPGLPEFFIEKYREWISKGYNASMHYMENPKRTNILEIYPQAKSIIVLTLSYYQGKNFYPQFNDYKISRYAVGKDYHIVLKKMLWQLLVRIKEEVDCDGIVCVDSAPVLEKAYGMKAGIGWIGKNSMLISPKYGSFFFIGILAVNIELPPDDSFYLDRCGTCSKCIESCPTHAINKDRTINSYLCISYLTIEKNRNEKIPEELAKKMDNWLFGCDICQEVCPWNKFAIKTLIEDFYPKKEFYELKLVDWLKMGTNQFKRKFNDSPLRRAGLKGIKRNVQAIL